MRREQRFLMDHRDAGLMSFGGAAEIGDLALPAHLAAITAQHAGDDLHQSGFAGPVFTDQGVDLAAVDFDVAAGERGGASEVFLDSLELKEHRDIQRGERCKVAQARCAAGFAS